ncbi:MAG TPA: tetratricopeptide repeat protein [Pyrinomonadaceae bacterium]|nr:tetratricopeptide repeat protein [Pyrinomonadaceae bacterium]
MMHRLLRICSSVVFGSVCVIAVTFAQDPAQPSNASSSPSLTPANKSSTPQARKRVRRTPRTQQPKAIPSPSPTPVATPAAAVSPTPEEPTPAESPETLPEELPLVELPAEEPAPRAKIERTPTPEARLREQLKAVEQMVAQGLRQEAVAELQLLAAEDRYDPQGFYNIANAFARLDLTDAAISTYRKAIEQRKGRYSRASNNLGVVLLRQGFWDQAYEAFLSALRVENFRYAEASYNLGRLYAARGEMDRAQREWKRAVAVDPNHAAANRALGNARGSTSSAPTSDPVPRPAESESLRPETERTSTKTSSNASSFRPYKLNHETYTLWQQGRTAHEQGRYEEAVINFRKVISRMGGYFSPANLEMSFSLIALQRNDEAIGSLLLVAERDGAKFPISYFHLGRLYELRGDLQLAEENYLRATQSYQNEFAQFLLNLSSVREKRGDFAGALVAMENYIKRKEKQGQKPDWSEARLATLREKAGTQIPKQ